MTREELEIEYAAAWEALQQARLNVQFAQKNFHDVCGLLMEKLMLENEVKELRVLAAEHRNTVFEMEDKIARFPEQEQRHYQDKDGGCIKQDNGHGGSHLKYGPEIAQRKEGKADYPRTYEHPDIPKPEAEISPVGEKKEQKHESAGNKGPESQYFGK